MRSPKKAGEIYLLLFYLQFVTIVSALLQKFLTLKNITMGRGDKKTKKGKIFKGSFGKSRPAKKSKPKKEEKKEE